MKKLKTYENFDKNQKRNNIKGNLITIDDIIDCIRNNGKIYATIIKDLPSNNPSKAVSPVSIDDDGLVTVEYDGNEYEVSLKNIESIKY
jgi:hypothetical protein